MATTKTTTAKKATKSTAVKKTAVPTAKKTAAKKATTAKASTRTPKAATDTMKSAGLICASDEHCFWTTDGRVLKSLEDLVFAFGSMDDTAFVYHANESKNDFAEWVEHVLQDAACAEDLRKSKSKKKAHTVVKKHLKSYR